ncbi:hypothetical protein [Petrocella sp. FN5]|nr:hypothetical protein [Petrocella sp. FN5]MDF1617687.1 hypothetical protein [Petrocella sp. FN5]
MARMRHTIFLLFSVLTYANMCGVKAIDRTVELYDRDIASNTIDTIRIIG